MQEGNFFVGHSNSKVGIGVAVISSPKSTCPDSCPLKNGACYGENPGPFNWFWNKISSGEKGVSFEKMVEQVEDLPRRSLVRAFQIGDAPGPGNRIDAEQLKGLTTALVAKNKEPYGYTHKPVLGKSKIARDNRKAIEEANKAGFIVALSANDLDDADKKTALGIAPVVVSVQSFSDMPKYTPQGHKLTACPEMTSKAKRKIDGVTKVITCDQCRLCAVPRKTIVAFENSSRRKQFKNSLKEE
jgi:hypothetical protein